MSPLEVVMLIILGWAVNVFAVGVAMGSGRLMGSGDRVFLVTLTAIPYLIASIVGIAIVTLFLYHLGRWVGDLLSPVA